MGLPRIEAVVTADTAQAETGFDRVGNAAAQMGSRVESAGVRARRLQTEMGGVRRSSRNMRMAVQNASFQFADMATMMEMGVDTSRVMAQQLPQLFGGFGALGAAIGAVIAIGIPLAVVFSSNADAAESLSTALGSLEPVVEAIADGMKALKPIIVSGLETLLNNLDRIIITASVAVGLFAVKWVAGFIAARIATFTLVGALTALRTALIRTGIGAFIVGIGELTYQFTRLVQATGSFGEALGMVKDVFVETWDRIKIAATAGVDYLAGQFARMNALFINAIAGMAASASDFFYNLGAGMRDSGMPMLDSMADSMLGVAQRIGQAAGSMSRTAGAAYSAATDTLNKSASGFDAASAPLESVKKIRDLLASIKDDKLTLSDLMGLGGDDEEDDGSKAKKKLDEELTAQEERIKEHFDRIKNLTQGGLSDKLGAWGEYFGSLASLTGTNNAKMLAISKSFGAAMALVDAWRAHNLVLADPTLPWWARIASAGQVLAAGIGAVSSIQSISAAGNASGGSAGASSSGGSGGAGGGNTIIRESNFTEIHVRGGSIFTAEQFAEAFHESNSSGYINVRVDP